MSSAADRFYHSPLNRSMYVPSGEYIPRERLSELKHVRVRGHRSYIHYNIADRSFNNGRTVTA